MGAIMHVTGIGVTCAWKHLDSATLLIEVLVDQEIPYRRQVVVMIGPGDIHIVPTKGAHAHILGRQFKGSENLYSIQLRSGHIAHSSESSLQLV